MPCSGGTDMSSDLVGYGWSSRDLTEGPGAVMADLEEGTAPHPGDQSTGSLYQVFHHQGAGRI